MEPGFDSPYRYHHPWIDSHLIVASGFSRTITAQGPLQPAALDEEAWRTAEPSSKPGVIGRPSYHVSFDMALQRNCQIQRRPYPWR